MSSSSGLKLTLVAFSVLWVTLANVGVARAETIYLKCYSKDFQSDYLYTIDLTKKTADGNSATITPILIHWVRKDSDGSSMTYNIDRTTGTLTLQGMIPGVGPTGVVTETCTAVSAPDTKF